MSFKKESEKEISKGLILKRFIAFLFDYLFIGIIMYLIFNMVFSQETLTNVLNESETNFFIENGSSIVFILYLLFSQIVFKRTLGMLLFKMKLKTEECIIMVSIIKLILIPFYIVNLFYYPIRKKLLQDELSNSNIIFFKQIN